jgi:hypothetical protein
MDRRSREKKPQEKLLGMKSVFGTSIFVVIGYSSTNICIYLYNTIFSLIILRASFKASIEKRLFLFNPVGLFQHVLGCFSHD